MFVQAPNQTLWVSSGQPLHLVSALSDDGSASGDLFWDNGESIDTYETNLYSYIIFNVAQVLRLVLPGKKEKKIHLQYPPPAHSNLHCLIQITHISQSTC